MRVSLCSFLLLAGFCARTWAGPGEKKWEFVIADYIYGLAAPTLTKEGDILIGSYEGTLYALTPVGAVRWSVATPSTIFGSPTVGPDGAIYFGSDQLHALNPDGTKRWDFAGAEDDPIGFTDTPVLGFPDPDHWRLRLKPLAGYLYTVQSSTNLLQWDTIDSQALPAGDSLSWLLDKQASAYGLRVFRAFASQSDRN